MLRHRTFRGLFLLLAALFLVTMAACTNTAENKKNENRQNQAQQNQQAQDNPNKQAAQPEQKAEAPRRGCPACHVKTAAKDYSLIAEAVERTKAGGGTHPTTAPDGKKMDENTTADVCLQCHAPAANGRGKTAPLSLRAILHPSHMSSTPFVDKYRGNCFTCHEVDATGTFNLLVQKVEVNEKGLPQKIPIPGMLPPSENPTKAAS